MPIGTTPIDMALFGEAAAAGAGPATGSGLQLEDSGTSFLLLENGDFLLLEE